MDHLMNSSATGPEHNAARRRWMGVLARASADDIARCLEALPPAPAHTRLRGPETGLVMVRGRAGGDGAPFNLGEMTVTRCAVRLADGRVGHAYVAGRDGRQAELAAVCDALMLDEQARPGVSRAVIEPLAAAQTERRNAVAGRAAATRVQFFTMTQMR
jgi:alpha-D-ribose 1-methylphosphonate 5-triphosphate synthase subunit PhnG